MIDEQLLSNDLLYVKGRYKTFKNWPFNENSNCSAIKMARAGFFACGDDAARCFFCLKTLEGWEEDDDPMEEHRSHKANCHFVRINKAEVDLTVNDMVDLLEARWNNILNAKHEEDLIHYKKLWECFENAYYKYKG